MRRFVAAVLLVSIAALTACSDQPTTGNVETMVGNDPARPFELYTPPSYREVVAAPLVILLHGLGDSGDIAENYFGLRPHADTEGFLFVHPDGTTSPEGDQFWNATDACCGNGSTVNDVAYITSIIDRVSATRNVDEKRVYLVGHSNGGFMSYRMACDLADRVAAIASLAGSTWQDPAQCAPSEPVSVLQMHGTEDLAIAYEGGARFPAATTTVAIWAAYNGCGAVAEGPEETLDLESALPGAETVIGRFDECPEGTGVELWTMQGAGHNPEILFADGSRPMTAGIVEWLFAHPKP